MSNINEKMAKIKLIELIREERALLEMTLARLTHAQMLLPGVDGEWSVKDALAHISAWERWMLDWTDSLLHGKDPAVPLPWDVDRMNAETFAQVKDKPLAEVLNDFRESYWDSIALVESLSEEQLQTIYPDKWPNGALWTGIAANMNWHYKEHRQDIEKWIMSKNQER